MIYDLVTKEFSEEPTDRNEIEVGKIAGNFGASYFKAGETEKALELLAKAETIAKKYADKNPNDLDSQYSYSVALYRHANTLEAIGKDEAKTRYSTCVQIRERLREQDPNLKNETMLMVARLIATCTMFNERVATRRWIVRIKCMSSKHWIANCRRERIFENEKHGRGQRGSCQEIRRQEPQ